jgi:hypothetical protein
MILVTDSLTNVQLGLFCDVGLYLLFFLQFVTQSVSQVEHNRLIISKSLSLNKPTCFGIKYRTKRKPVLKQNNAFVFFSKLLISKIYRVYVRIVRHIVYNKKDTDLIIEGVTGMMT